MIDLVPHAIYAKDAEGRYLLANRTTARYLGREPHELLGRRPDEFGLDPAGAERDREVDREVLRTQRRRDGEVVRRFHGEDIDFAFSKIPFSFGGQVTDAVLGVSTDISGLKRAEAQLKESVALLQATLQATDNGVLVTDPGGRLLLWNERMVALLGGPGPLQDGDKTAVLAALGSQRLAAEVAGTVQQLGQRADGPCRHRTDRTHGLSERDGADPRNAGERREERLRLRGERPNLRRHGRVGSDLESAHRLRRL